MSKAHSTTSSGASKPPTHVPAGTLFGYVAALQSSETAVDACHRLNEWIEVLEGRILNLSVYDEEEVRGALKDVGRIVREGGGVEALAALASVAEPAAHQAALLLLSNLASETLDINGYAETRRTLKDADILSTLLPHLNIHATVGSEPNGSRLYALGLLMNTACAGDASMVETLQMAQIPQRLHELSTDGDQYTTHFAKLCLLGYAEALTLHTMQRFARTPAGAALISRPIACSLNFVLRLRARRAKSRLLRRDIRAATKIQGMIRARNARREAKKRKQRSERP